MEMTPNFLLFSREADTVLEVTPETGEPFIVYIEWQSGNDQRMAFRMARYDLLLCDSYNQKVMGMVIYVGEKPMSMENSFHSFGLQYTCPIMDIRDISPDVFLSSDDPGDVAFFSEKLKHLELLAQLSGLNLQEQLIKEEETMPITIDIKKDLRYQQGVKQGLAEGMMEAQKQNALKMLEKGISLSYRRNYRFICERD